MRDPRSGRTFFIFIALFVTFVFRADSSSAQELAWSEAGTRGGYIETTSGEFQQVEVHAERPMKRSYILPNGWTAAGRWEMSAGVLSHEGIDGVVVALGPVMVLRKGNEDWFLEAGSRPTLISEHDFNQKDFGGPFQFTSHAEVGWGFRRFEISYRIQHMSNARIYSDNDGLNLHVVEIAWRF